LLKILVTNPNFLILDEPTNDFDIDTLNVLEDFLDKFTGCLILVSHDRYFMDHLVNELFVFEGDGKIQPFNGNYSDYRLREDAEDEPAVVVKKAEAPAQTESKKKFSFKEKKEHEDIQKQISNLEAEKKAITEQIERGNLDTATLVETSKRLQSINDELDQRTLRWLELDEIVGQ
jgi:ABC transport system ATP-binding/permease protein